MPETIKNFFKNKKNYKKFGIFLFLSFAINIWISQLHFLLEILPLPYFSFFEKIKLLFFSLGNFLSSMETLNQITTIVISILMALNLSIMSEYLKSTKSLRKAQGSSFFGMIFAIFGVGCSSCGSVLLTSIIGIGSVHSLMAFFPFGGIEIHIISIGLLLFSLSSMDKAIMSPLGCKIQ